MLGGVEYLGVDDTGLRIKVDGAEHLPELGRRVLYEGVQEIRFAVGS